jgi:hypothetical protein
MARMTAVRLVLAASLGTPPSVAAAQRLRPPPMLRVGTTVPARVSWRTSEVALAGAFAVALAIDAAQTRSLAQRGWQGYGETNPILGPRPSVGQVNTYTAAAAVTVLGVAAVAPPRVRPWLLGAALAVETLTIAGNMRQGVALKFP